MAQQRADQLLLQALCGGRGKEHWLLGFFEMLYRPGEYDEHSYERVSNWGANVGYEVSESGKNIGLRSLAQLFVPINITNTRWIFLRVLLQQRCIELYDSQLFCPRFGWPIRRQEISQKKMMNTKKYNKT